MSLYGAMTGTPNYTKSIYFSKIRRARVSALSALLTLTSSSALAEPPCESGEGRRCPKAGEQPASRPYTTVVRGTSPAPGTAQITREQLLSNPANNLGEAISGVEGVDLVRRSTKVVEPSLRGLSGERVQTLVDGVPLYGACPSKMDPPLNYLGIQAAEHAVVSRSLPSVTWGPVGSGGRLRLSLDYERRQDAPPEVHADAFTSYDSAQSGFRFGGAVEGGDGLIDLRVTTSVLRFGDYTSSAGLRVPARQDQQATSLSFGLRPKAGHRIWQGLIYQHESDVSYPALPMDNRDTSFWLYGIKYRLDRPGDRLERVVVRGGLSRVDHLMDNQDKANRVKLWASTPALSGTYSAAAQATLRLGHGLRLDTGLDYRQVYRDALRSRRIVATDKAFEDHVWPDAVVWDLGLFGELSWRQTDQLRWLVGLRGDVARSAAGASGDPSLGGLTVAEQYARYYGADAAQTDRTELLGAAQLKLQWRPLKVLRGYLGTGFSMRPAGITERFFAFGPAPGGFQIGNPTLTPEKKWSTELGIRLAWRWLEVDLSGHYAWAPDFIYRAALDRRDVNGDGIPDLIRGYRNVSAHLWGGELAAVLRPWKHISVPLGLSYVHAVNTSDDRPLPEIAPLNAHLAARLQSGETIRWWFEPGARFALPQRRVDQAFGEDETEGHVEVRLRAGFELDSQLQLQLAVENLFDADFNEHLTREALFTAGDLKAGDEVPAPGRRVILTLRGRI
jgi:iron complex outermembrane recepter protein